MSLDSYDEAPDPKKRTDVLTPGQMFLADLKKAFILHPEDWENLPEEARDAIASQSDKNEVLSRLVDHHLLTEYQAARVGAGKTHGMLLGSYRVLERLGAGGMGIVFKGEHVRLRRPVAIKVLPMSPEEDAQRLTRFFTEVRTVAQLQHPNIVAAMDTGESHGDAPHTPVIYYHVMEYVPGQNLEDLVLDHGPLPVIKACDLVYQVANALAEAHKHHLVHRDIKPSNILVTPEGQAKLLDFGLVRHFSHRMTEPGTVLGTIEYIAPEQIHNSSGVDIRADIFGLGGTLFWCLTAKKPFATPDNPNHALAARLEQAARPVRAYRPEVSAELDAVVARMMAPRPEDRYATPDAVSRALLPFIRQESQASLLLAEAAERAGPSLGLADEFPAAPRTHRVLVVDDEPAHRKMCRIILDAEGVQCDEAADGGQALQLARQKPFDLVLLDIDMPVLKGTEVLRQLREDPPAPHLKIVMLSGRATSDEMAQMMLAGADDYLSKPFGLVQLKARVKAALRLKEAQDHADLMNRHLLAMNHQLEQNLHARDSDLIHARNALVLALAELVAYRGAETGAHLKRMQRYARCLAEAAAQSPSFASQVDLNFIQNLEGCAPLHDLGKIALPEHILLKPGQLAADERIIMQTHTTIGSEILEKVAKQHGFALGFLRMAIDIARHHHERFDGNGYPDRLEGSAIPLAARIVTVGDVYDALRSRRPHKPALSHAATVQMMSEASGGVFDPALLKLFQVCASQFERIFREMSD